jgi:ubiquinone/menaquinone biosynthesis C-methylase UbiE
MIKCRDIFRPREIILREVDIKPGTKVLDFGCGPGSYTIHLSNTVGESGKVYALDIHPLAIKKVKRISSKLGLVNVEMKCSDCVTGLADNEIDTVLLYDIFHMLDDKRNVLSELHRDL